MKCSNVFEESLDEGYADSNSTIVAISGIHASTPKLLKPEFLDTINDVLARSKFFWEPVQFGLNQLQEKLEKYKNAKIYSNTPVVYFNSSPQRSQAVTARSTA